MIPPSRATSFFTLVPDWVCEVLSPATATLDREKKMRVYAREGVEYLWLVEPPTRTLEAYRRQETRWVLQGSSSATVPVQAEPFQELSLRLGLLWQR